MCVRVSRKEQPLSVSDRRIRWLGVSLRGFPSHKIIYDGRPRLKCENISDGNLGVMDTTDPIGFKV